MDDFFKLPYEKQVSAVFGSINHEFRNIALLLLDEHYRTGPELSVLYEWALDQSNKEAVKVERKTIQSYCERVFLPYGMVNEGEKINQKNKMSKSWAITDIGKQIGQPAAALAISTACRYNCSLKGILGVNYVTEISSPYVAASVLDLLANKIDEAVMFKDIKSTLSLETQPVGHAIERLVDFEFINYNSTGGERGWSVYRWISGKKSEDVKPKLDYNGHKMIKLTGNIAQWMYDNKEGTYRQLEEAFGKKRIKNQSSPESTMLSYLAEQGFVEKISEFTLCQKQSDINITEDGLDFYNEFISPILMALKDEDYRKNEFRGSLEAYQKNSDLFRKDITFANILYKQVSPAFNRQSRDIRKKNILGYIEKNGKQRMKNLIQIGHDPGMVKELQTEKKLERILIENKEENRYRSIIYYIIP